MLRVALMRLLLPRTWSIAMMNMLQDDPAAMITLAQG